LNSERVREFNRINISQQPFQGWDGFSAGSTQGSALARATLGWNLLTPSAFDAADLQ
jgi:hypothetical protein